MFILNIIQRLTWGDVRKFVLANKPKENGMAAKVGEGHVTEGYGEIAGYEILVGNSISDNESSCPLIQANLQSLFKSSKLILEARENANAWFEYFNCEGTEKLGLRLGDSTPLSVLNDKTMIYQLGDDLQQWVWDVDAAESEQENAQEYYRASVRALGYTVFQAVKSK